ncbi:MAG: DnaJ domain-containing protein [Acidimicrobiia bacterium]|nr:DnaJ domain-containing protein [Acidimicrobiia bacterium]
MDRHEAAAVLGVHDTASTRQVRAAYRQRIREHHPDRAGPDATVDAARIIEAYEVMSAPAPAPAPAPVTAPSRRGRPDHSVMLVDDDTVAFAFPADEVFALLVEAADDIGDITYVDPDAGLLEVLVTLAFGGPWSVVISLQGRMDRVEAFCTVEALDGSDAQPGPVVSLLLDSLRRRLRGR